MLKEINKILVLLLLVVPFASCDDTVTYSEMKEKERDAVAAYINEKGINVISYEQFVANDSVTDVKNNEYVLVDDVYMQIVNNPVKTDPAAYRIEHGDNVDLLIRYYEYNIQEGDTITGNLYAADADEMRVSNNSGSVPTGWLVPLRFLTFTRKQANLAKVNIIVPHTKGTSNAATYVYPCHYQISFQPSVAVMIPE